jgi:antitoxin VapB
MAMNIKDEQTHEMVRELTRLTGESQADAVRVAVQERLARARRKSKSQVLLELGRRIAAGLPDELKNVDHGDLLYDDMGLPR